jgi:hypothetical protein
MTVTLSLFAGAGAQFFDNSGVILSGGKIYTYLAGTTTPLAVYTTNSQTAFHTNPIILDSAGRVPSGGEIWLQLGIGYKFVLKTSTEVLIATYDNIPSSAQPPAANDADSIMYEQGYTVAAGSFVVGKIYRIAFVGTTNFTLIGAANNTIGTHFIATGVGTGTGTAELAQTVETKLRESVSVQDFGAVGDGVADDTAAVQAFFNYVAVNAVGIAVLEGQLKITSGVTLTGSSTKFYRANCNLIAGAAIAGPMLTIQNASFVRFSGSLQLTGTGSATYSSRTVDSGLLLVNSGRAQFESIRAENFKLYGVYAEGGNSNLVDWGNLRFQYCGPTDSGISSISSSFSSRSNTGIADSRGQRTILSGVTVPSGITSLRSMVLISGSPYMITASNSGAGTVEVYPWVPSTITSGTVFFILGAAFYSTGSDNNVQTVQSLDATLCSIACLTPAIFAETVQKFSAQSCAIGIMVGNGITSGSQGGNYDYCYFESNVFDVIQTTNALTGIKIGPSSTIDWAKVLTLAPIDASDVKRAVSESFDTSLFFQDGLPYWTTGNYARNAASSTQVLSLNSVPGNFRSVKSNSFTLSLVADDDLNRIFWAQDAYYMILGTGPRNNPTGTITVTPTSGTVNGLASTTFSSITGPLLLHCFWQVDTDNWIVTPYRNETQLFGSATYNPPSLNDGDGVTTTVTVTGSELGDYVSASFNQSLQSILVTAWVSAADTVSVRFQNETGGVIDLASGTLRARVIKAV